LIHRRFSWLCRDWYILSFGLG